MYILFIYRGIRGIKYRGIIYGGIIYRGIIYRGIIYRGIIYRGIKYRGNIYGGIIYRGIIYRGIIYRGIIYRGIIYRGIIYRGIIYRSIISRGIIYRGIIYMGIIDKGIQGYTRKSYYFQIYIVAEFSNLITSLKSIFIINRSAMAKFRCGIAPINIEIGRYYGISANKRFCHLCSDVVEDEIVASELKDPI